MHEPVANLLNPPSIPMSLLNPSAASRSQGHRQPIHSGCQRGKSSRLRLLTLSAAGSMLSYTMALWRLTIRIEGIGNYFGGLSSGDVCSGSEVWPVVRVARLTCSSTPIAAQNTVRHRSFYIDPLRIRRKHITETLLARRYFIDVTCGIRYYLGKLTSGQVSGRTDIPQTFHEHINAPHKSRMCDRMVYR